jgi:hypothetical protein
LAAALVLLLLADEPRLEARFTEEIPRIDGTASCW